MWHQLALQGNAAWPFTFLHPTSQKQILRMSGLSLIYLPKSFHQENIYVEISPGYSPPEFHFLFILLTNSVIPAVSKLPLLFSYMFIDDFTLLVLYLFRSDCWNCFLSMCSVFCLGLFFFPLGRQWERQEGAGAWGKVSNVFKLKPQWRKMCIPSILHFQCFHSTGELSLPCIASYLTSFYFSHRSAAVSILWASRTLYNTRCSLPVSFCVIISRCIV